MNSERLSFSEVRSQIALFKTFSLIITSIHFISESTQVVRDANTFRGRDTVAVNWVKN